MPSLTFSRTSPPGGPGVMKTLLLAAATLATLATPSQASLSRPCPDGQFFSHDAGVCQTCARCPKNLIIRFPCGQDSDTICGPFIEFYEFHQAPRPTFNVKSLDGQDDDEEEGEEKGWRSPAESDRWAPAGPFAGDGKTPRKYASFGTSAELDPDDDPGIPDRGRFEDGDSSRVVEVLVDEAYQNAGTPCPPGQSEPGVPQREMPLEEQQEEEEEQWKVLALALLVVLCVVCIALLAFLFIVCYLRGNRPHAKKGVFCGGTADEPSVRGDQRGRPSSLPHRYVPVPVLSTSHASATSARERSQTTSSGPVPEPEAPSAQDGQVQVTSSSSEYVYFNSPHNGNEAADV